MGRSRLWALTSCTLSTKQGSSPTFRASTDPHDLQHRHLPELFTADQLAYRERWYGVLCAQATVVAVASSWTRDDVIHQFGLTPEKVHVVPWAPSFDVVARPGDAETSIAKLRFGLPEHFVLYPAQTWPHKNHLNLVRALAMLRSRDGLLVPLVFTGLRNDGAKQVDAEGSG